ncbi:doxorubicin biosynthesis protein DnrV [Wenjunlia vitaminophila]|uniref:Doxorubicin biosynthesis protein DnrV n=1 Tax=Wenjunlia vitaminophila TaxID=76728 RepID=A0A0T6LUT3_WENVI|nr:VOC family protein [Wenjunlia vitaminophila]KRV49752.1 doxorubicin biosynthesis protein DnrV [Wenjunlia vitaminophila]
MIGLSETGRAVHGAPCWVGLLARDLDPVRDFYSALLGWDYVTDGLRTSVIARLGGTPVGSLFQDSSFTLSWTPYFGVDNADIAAERIRERGGTVAVGPMDIPQSGRVAWAADPSGAAFGIWQGVDRGWRLGGGRGTPARLELRTRDAFAAALFYGGVFAWDRADPQRFEIRYENDRVFLLIDGRRTAGLFGGAVEAAPDPRVRPRWHVYFSVDDADLVAAEVRELGGEVEEEPHDTPYGRVASLRDPQGGRFSITTGE